MKLLIALAFLLFIVSMATPVSSHFMNFKYFFFQSFTKLKKLFKNCAEQIPSLKKDNIVPLQKNCKDQTGNINEY